VEEDDVTLEELAAPPTNAQVPAPPVVTAPQTLPFDELTWENFERLCYRLVRLEADVERARSFGVRGQDQAGVDIFARRNGAYSVYQCKRVAQFGPADVVRAVESFLEGEWAARSDRFVLCISHEAIRTDVARAVEVQASVLQERDPPVAFEIWDSEELSARLKEHPQLVDDFFGEAWANRFLPGYGEDALGEFRGRQEPLVPAVRVVLLNWAPELLAEQLERFVNEDPDRFTKLQDLVGNPPEPALVSSAIRTPSFWLRHSGDSRTWRHLAAYAEREGQWAEASLAWEEAAGRTDDSETTAELLVATGVAADVGGDVERRDNSLTALAR
jgi:hypothetical protein